jgi:hypothetical protein
MLRAGNLIAASVHDEYSVRPIIRTVCTRYCLTMTDVIQKCTNFHEGRVLVINSRPDEILLDF